MQTHRRLRRRLLQEQRLSGQMIEVDDKILMKREIGIEKTGKEVSAPAWFKKKDIRKDAKTEKGNATLQMEKEEKDKDDEKTEKDNAMLPM